MKKGSWAAGISAALLLLLAVTGCAGDESHPHPALEMQKEERIAHRICDYPRSVVAAQGKDALETYVIECE